VYENNFTHHSIFTKMNIPGLMWNRCTSGKKKRDLASRQEKEKRGISCFSSGFDLRHSTYTLD